MAEKPEAGAESAGGSEASKEEDAGPFKPKRVHQAHDALITAATDNPERVLDLLHSLLPRKFRQALADVPPVALDTQMLSEELQRRRADRVWRLEVKPGYGPRYIHLAAEFQSTVDLEMAWRTKDYADGIHDREASLDEGGRRVPAVVVPIVIYTGRAPWTAKKSFADLANAHSFARLWHNNSRYILRDLARMKPNRRAKRGDMRAVWQALVCATLEKIDVEEVAETILKPMPESSDLAVRLLVYMIQELPCSQRAIREATRIAWPNRGNEMLGMAEAELVAPHRQEAEAIGIAKGEAIGIAKGKAEGRAEGKAEGKAEGRAEGKAELLLEMLERRFGDIPERVRDLVRSASDEQRDQWSNAFADGHSLKRILRENGAA